MLFGKETKSFPEVFLPFPQNNYLQPFSCDGFFATMVNAGKWIVPSRQKKLPRQQFVDVYFESYERCIISNRKEKTFKTLSSKNYSIIKFHFHDSQDLSHVIYFMPSGKSMLCSISAAFRSPVYILLFLPRFYEVLPCIMFRLCSKVSFSFHVFFMH